MVGLIKEVELHDCLIQFMSRVVSFIPLAMLFVNLVSWSDYHYADIVGHLLLQVTDRTWGMECMGGWMIRSDRELWLSNGGKFMAEIVFWRLAGMVGAEHVQAIRSLGE